VKSLADYARKVEFVCSVCLASVQGRNDDDPIPRCARCLIKMLPDSDEPLTYLSALRPQASRRKAQE
jgi:hypothetical protein